MHFVIKSERPDRWSITLCASGRGFTDIIAVEGAYKRVSIFLGEVWQLSLSVSHLIGLGARSDCSQRCLSVATVKAWTSSAMMPPIVATCLMTS